MRTTSLVLVGAALQQVAATVSLSLPFLACLYPVLTAPRAGLMLDLSRALPRLTTTAANSRKVASTGADRPKGRTFSPMVASTFLGSNTSTRSMPKGTL